MSSATLILLAAVAAEESKAEEPSPGSTEAVEEAMKLTSTAVGLFKAKSFVDAIDHAERAAALAPGAPGPRNLLGDLHMKLGDCAKALRWYREFERVGRDSKALKIVRKSIAAAH